MKGIAIIGAGVSGLATAIALRDSDCKVVSFEKSRGVSGRVASRTREGVRYDHGANYFKTDSPEVERLVHEELSREGLVDIAKDVWIFDGTGVILPGDPAQNAEPKWTYEDGISTLGKRMAANSGATFRNVSRVGSLQRIGERWGILGDDGDVGGLFDAVVVTPPAPQAAQILSQSSLDDEINSRLITALEQSRYHYQMSCVLAFDSIVPRCGEFYALVNTDRQHAVAWLSFEEDKPGHVPAGKSVLIAQMAPDWSGKMSGEEDSVVVESITRAVEELLDVKLPARSWFDLQRWRFAHPASAADVNTLRQGESIGLFFAGDSLVGQGRVPRAIETGIECEARIATALSL